MQKTLLAGAILISLTACGSESSSVIGADTPDAIGAETSFDNSNKPSNDIPVFNTPVVPQSPTSQPEIDDLMVVKSIMTLAVAALTAAFLTMQEVVHRMLAITVVMTVPVMNKAHATLMQEASLQA